MYLHSSIIRWSTQVSSYNLKEPNEEKKNIVEEYWKKITLPICVYLFIHNNKLHTLLYCVKI